MEIDIEIEEVKLDEVADELDKMLGKVANELLQKAKDNIIKMDAVASGELYRSGYVRKVDDCKWEVGFDCDYAIWVEYGRDSGKIPPVDKIKEWLMVKFGYDEKTAKRKAWAIAKKIAEEGTRPKPFFRKAIHEVIEELK